MLFCREKKNSSKKRRKNPVQIKFAKKEGHDDLFFLPARFDDPTHIV
jgi:hypothetical protein